MHRVDKRAIRERRKTDKPKINRDNALCSCGRGSVNYRRYAGGSVKGCEGVSAARALDYVLE